MSDKSLSSKRERRGCRLEEVLKVRIVRLEREDEMNWRRGRCGREAKSREALSLSEGEGILSQSSQKRRIRSDLTLPHQP